MNAPIAPFAPSSVPVALLPVGLETRFSADTLLVRIIPDEIHVEDHEPGLTDAEVDAGRQFWIQVWHGGTAEPAATEHEQQAWSKLVSAIGNSRRAAWVADRTEPTGGTRPGTPVPDAAELTDPPVFGEPPRRAGPWTRPALTRTLPDRFVAIAYRRVGSGGQVSYEPMGAPVFGAPVADSIQLGFDPGDTPPPVNDEGPSLPEGMRWLTEPDAAESAGLLIRIPLPPGTDRIARLVVLGVLGSIDAATAAERLSELLVGHHYSTGLSLIPIGTPTNNTGAERSGFAKSDDPVVSFGIERRTPAAADGTDGGLLVRALGIPSDTLRGVAHSDDTEQAAAGHMNALVWPASVGYWLETLIQQPGPNDAAVNELRTHTVQMLRGRGPLPPLRVGRQPYGVLPITSLKDWVAGSEPPSVVRATQLVRCALPWWMDGVDRAPVVRTGADPDHGTLDMLGQAPVSTTVGIRSMVGANACFIPQPWLTDGASPGDEANRQRWMALTAFGALGVQGLPYVGQLVAQTTAVPLFDLPYTVDPRRRPADAAADWAAITRYLRGLRSRLTRDLQAEDPRGTSSLLTLLARRSVMLERVRSGIADTTGVVAGSMVEAHVRIDDAAIMQAQLISTSATLRIGDTRSTVGAILAGSVRQADGSVIAMTDHLDRQLVLQEIDHVRDRGYADTVAAAEAVAGLTADRAGLLLGESLDLASHRIDAWITGLATSRLSDLRASQPTGVTLGAYGAVEDLVRQPPRLPVTQPPPGVPTPVVEDVSGGGWLHAPSMAQAATAAVLRAGHLAHAAGDPGASALAIDLSSGRVRTALGLLDGVRQGQSLGALLGYRAERKLHELGAHTAVEVVRRLAPPPVLTATGTPEGLPPTSVCDGLALSRMDRSTVIAAVDGGDAAAMGSVLNSLVDSVDAVADLLLAEGVHQIVLGNPERAAGALNTLNCGEGAGAEPEVVRTPRTGTSLTHRALVLLAAETPTAPGWPTAGVRAQVEPRLAGWAGHLLGDPSGLEITVHDHDTISRLALTDLQVGALDLVFEPLEARILRHARMSGASESATVDLSAPAIAGMLTVADSLHELISRARPATGVDLARPQDRGTMISGPPPLSGGPDNGLSTRQPDLDAGDRQIRLTHARARLDAAAAAIAPIAAGGPVPTEASLVQPLEVLAAFGIAPGGDPARSPTAAALIEVCNAAAARSAAAAAAPDDPAALFGEGFPVLPLVAPPEPANLAAALAADPVAAAPAELLGPVGGQAGALTSWVEDYGRVRPAVGRLADLLLAARLRGTTGPSELRAIQMPVEPFPAADAENKRRWVGLPFPGTLGPDPVTNVVALVRGSLDATVGIAGLVIDEFSETIPAMDTTTAVSFGFDAPGARPPQSILLAVPPVPGANWSVEGLAQAIGETLDLAKTRMVDLSSVAWAGRIVPALYLTDGDVASGLDFPIRELVQIARNRAQAVMHS